MPSVRTCTVDSPGSPRKTMFTQTVASAAGQYAQEESLSPGAVIRVVSARGRWGDKATSFFLYHRATLQRLSRAEGERRLADAYTK